MKNNRDWLIDKRKKECKKQAEVAKDADISFQYYSRIENGERNPSVVVAKRIAKALNFEWTLFYE